MLLLYLIGLGICVLIIYYKHQDNNKTRLRCEANGILYDNTSIITILYRMVFGTSIVDLMLENYKKAKELGYSYALTSNLGDTALLVRDPEILKLILVKDFDHFVDHRKFFGNSKKDYTLNKMLFVLSGEPWKMMRTKLSPTFTTGKIKRLFSRFDNSGKKFVKFLESEIKNKPDGEIELTQAYSKYTMDVVASAVCGMDSEAFNQRDPSIFEKMGNNLRFKFGVLGMLNMFLLMSLPKYFSDILGLHMFDLKSQDFFAQAIKYSMSNRRNKGERHDDFLQLMLETQEGKLKTDESELDTFEKEAQIKETDNNATSGDVFSDDDIVANCVQFILAGFDTLQSLLVFAAYSLALNPNVQEKLRNDINDVLQKGDGELSYESVGRMTYLDMVIQETLRRWPPAVATDRLCIKDYKIPGTDILVKKGEGIDIPIFGFHMDPDIYPNPENFEPERFSSERKGSINPYTYIPFGQGPRNCIGMRFALSEAKVVIAQLVRNFEIKPSKKTLIPMKFTNEGSLKPKGGMYLSLTKINSLK